MHECLSLAAKETECRGLAAEAVSERLPSGPGQRVTTSENLPAGFKHTLRLTSGRPAGWVQYEAECPVHSTLRTADRIGKLIEIFKAHADCRHVAPCPSTR